MSILLQLNRTSTWRSTASPSAAWSRWVRFSDLTASEEAQTQNSHLQRGRLGFSPWVGKIPWRRKWQPTPVFLPGESYGQRTLAGSLGSQRIRHDWMANTLPFTEYEDRRCAHSLGATGSSGHRISLFLPLLQVFLEFCKKQERWWGSWSLCEVEAPAGRALKPKSTIFKTIFYSINMPWLRYDFKMLLKLTSSLFSITWWIVGLRSKVRAVTLSRPGSFQNSNWNQGFIQQQIFKCT